MPGGKTPSAPEGGTDYGEDRRKKSLAVNRSFLSNATVEVYMFAFILSQLPSPLGVEEGRLYRLP